MTKAPRPVRSGSGRASRKPRVGKTPAPDTSTAATTDADTKAFTDSLIRHGQAVRRSPDGTLAPEATHEIVDNPDGTVRVVRRRFSAF